MKLHPVYYYAITFTALSGLGIVFLNAESILAVCFFLFFYLIIQNSDTISASLNQQKQSIRAELLSCMIDGQTLAVRTRKLLIYKKIMLLDSMQNIVYN